MIKETEMDFEVVVDSKQFSNMSKEDRELLLDSLSEKEKFDNLEMFKTLPNGKVGWNKEK